MAIFNKFTITTILLTITIYVTQSTMAECDLAKIREIAYSACDIMQDQIRKPEGSKVKRENAQIKGVENTTNDLEHNFNGRYRIPKYFEIKNYLPKCDGYIVVDHAMAHLLLKANNQNIGINFQHINLHHDHHQCSNDWKTLNVTSTFLIKNQNHHHHHLQHHHHHQLLNKNHESIRQHNRNNYQHNLSENEVIKKRSKRSLSRKISWCCASENKCAHDICLQ